MPLERAKEIISEIASNVEKPSIIICGYGEPFCRPHIYDILDYLFEKKITTIIQSNGKWQLKKERVNSLLKARILSITIDGISNEIFQLSRPNTDVHRIFDNLKSVIEARNKYSSSSSFKTQVRMNVFEFNKKEVKPMIDYCKSIGVDKVLLGWGQGLLSVITQPNENEFTCYDPKFLDIHPGLIGKNHHEVSKQKRQGNRKDSNEISQNKQDINNPASANLIESGFIRRWGCPAITFRWDGQVTPCCYDHNVKIPIGDLNKQPLFDILSLDNQSKMENKILSERAQRFFQNKLNPCDRCSYLAQYMEKNQLKTWNTSTYEITNWEQKLETDVIADSENKSLMVVACHFHDFLKLWNKLDLSGTDLSNVKNMVVSRENPVHDFPLPINIFEVPLNMIVLNQESVDWRKSKFTSMVETGVIVCYFNHPEKQIRDIIALFGLTSATVIKIPKAESN